MLIRTILVNAKRLEHSLYFSLLVIILRLSLLLSFDFSQELTDVEDVVEFTADENRWHHGHRVLQSVPHTSPSLCLPAKLVDHRCTVPLSRDGPGLVTGPDLSLNAMWSHNHHINLILISIL